jgi:murein peptide amidase A
MRPHPAASPIGVALLAVALLAAGCSGDIEPDAAAPATTLPAATPGSTSTPSTLAPTTTSATTTSSPPTTSTSTTTSTTTTSTSTTTSTTSTTTTAAPAIAPSGSGAELVPFRPLDLTADVVELGTSVLGVPIVAERYGTPGGRRVLVIGVIHGNEHAGTAIVQQLRASGTPEGVELWLVESMNPDGQAIDDRHNANQVDLNRNFPYKWGPLEQPGDGQYAGTGPASEPETQAMVNFIAQLRPDIAIWYHQDLFVISPAEGREGRIRERYASLTGLPMGGISGGTYTGIAATWARTELRADDSVAFIVELGETLSLEEAAIHADAIRTIAVEG